MKKLLVANRGEIAVRIIRTAHEMGIVVVAVVSEADKTSYAAELADEVIVIGPAPASLSYLNQDAVLKAAIESGADAVHPGYGFLSENAAFARKVIAAGITWVGPSPESIELMGDKSRARQAAIDAGVPTLRGTEGALRDGDDIVSIAAGIGYPLVVKASAGGGGRGIRLVASPADLVSTVGIAQAEALAAFNSSDVYFELFVTRARHVEVQIFGDGENYVHLGDRDCSMQRRQQKVLEEAPAPGLPDHVRQLMRDSSVDLARQASYVGAGTVEFLYDPETEEVAFIEMNTRLQVEHPITEAITGIDLVREQLRIASGEKLGYSQEDVAFTGHALEFRINAEDPSNNFMPSPGVISSLHLPGGPGVRVDFGFIAGNAVAPFYDSLLGKIIVWAPTRDLAISRAERVLGEARIEGVKTTAGLLRTLVALDDFRQVTHHTAYIESVPDLLGVPA
ncbi:biotin carboxylase [Cryobacterium psychrotolerans]|uniref:biotin carboxylase n=1 Tax=Cryobacterium psychrotolerans TaxID=386301 RepID=A0A1G9D257_9MICO|nr:MULTISPECIES: acetyl-CoA carboxylase biotin carboxylase subunit [Cryobacterium]TFD41377.1 acetyl-CoA carboxylase biotin carboxylase subunit [Cryobacterium sp. TMT1-2-1]TFD90253.1 acetyl-CoA carboxylase biotin carboxylase subunit [Cryobacterium psychrotolerans]SDK57893.1 biotin carboxylase [Cryobacterium psychrotolerans]